MRQTTLCIVFGSRFFSLFIFHSLCVCVSSFLVCLCCLMLPLSLVYCCFFFRVCVPLNLTYLIFRRNENKTIAGPQMQATSTAAVHTRINTRYTKILPYYILYTNGHSHKCTLTKHWTSSLLCFESFTRFMLLLSTTPTTANVLCASEWVSVCVIVFCTFLPYRNFIQSLSLVWWSNERVHKVYAHRNISTKASRILCRFHKFVMKDERQLGYCSRCHRCCCLAMIFAFQTVYKHIYWPREGVISPVCCTYYRINFHSKGDSVNWEWLKLSDIFKSRTLCILCTVFVLYVVVVAVVALFRVCH